MLETDSGLANNSALPTMGHIKLPHNAMVRSTCCMRRPQETPMAKPQHTFQKAFRIHTASVHIGLQFVPLHFRLSRLAALSQSKPSQAMFCYKEVIFSGHFRDDCWLYWLVAAWRILRFDRPRQSICSNTHLHCPAGWPGTTMKGVQT